jgi:hypothetical protein
MEATILQFVPIMIICVVYAVIVFIIAKKRGINPWIWTITTLIPVIGIFVAAVFMLLSFLSVFDRLSTLEAQARTESFS